jgi:hypothetical protein
MRKIYRNRYRKEMRDKRYVISIRNENIGKGYRKRYRKETRDKRYVISINSAIGI